MNMKTMNEINITDMEKVRGGMAFDLINREVVPGQIPPEVSGVRYFWEPVPDLPFIH